ncbi:hypothetical protein PM082_021454 [Marasmius tenuissimus]|nr:hypothetical protein PM082_021454 [Marasmius tenuissimus]
MGRHILSVTMPPKFSVRILESDLDLTSPFTAYITTDTTLNPPSTSITPPRHEALFTSSPAVNDRYSSRRPRAYMGKANSSNSRFSIRVGEGQRRSSTRRDLREEDIQG